MDEESKKPTVIVSIPGVTILPPVDDETGELIAPKIEQVPVAQVQLVKKAVTKPPKTFKRVEVKPRSDKVTSNDVAEHLFYLSQPGQVGALNTSETKSVFLEDAAKQSVLTNADLELEETWVPTNHLDRRPGEDDIQGWAKFYYAHTYEVPSDRRLAKLMKLSPIERVEVVRTRREAHQQKLLELARKASREAVAGESRVGAITVAGAVALFLGLMVIFSADKTRASSENASTSVEEPTSEADKTKARNERYQNYCPDEYLVSLKYDGVIEAGDAQGKCSFSFTHAADKLRYEDELAVQRPAPVVEEVKAEASPEPEAAVPELVAPPAPSEEPRTEVFREDCERVGAVSIPMLKFEREAFKEQGVAIWRRLNFQKVMRKSEDAKAFLCESGEGGAEAMMLRRYCGQLARASEKVFADYLPTTISNLRNLRQAKASGCGD